MDFARNERGFCVGFAWNLILFSFVREREGYKHHADCTVPRIERPHVPSFCVLSHQNTLVFWGRVYRKEIFLFAIKRNFPQMCGALSRRNIVLTTNNACARFLKQQVRLQQSSICFREGKVLLSFSQERHML